MKCPARYGTRCLRKAAADSRAGKSANRRVSRWADYGGKIDRMLTRRSSKSSALVGFAVFGLAVAGTAIGALAIGALAIGALGIGNLGMGTGRIEELSIAKLTVDELVVKRHSDGN